MSLEKISEIIVTSSDIRVTMLTRIIMANARRDQAIADLQTAILKNIRVLIGSGIEEDFTDPMATLLNVSLDSSEAMGQFAEATNDMIDRIYTELFAVEAAHE